MNTQNSFLIEDEFGFLEIGTLHNTKRIKSMMSNMVKHPGKSIFAQSSSRTEAKAAYQLLNNENVDLSELRRIHTFKTIDRIAERQKPILLIQDTTQVCYSSQAKKKGLGIIQGNVKGTLIHTLIATTQEGVALGVLSQSNFCSDPDTDASLTKYERRIRPIEEKESYRWIEAFHEASIAIPKDIDATVISDREGDIFEYFVAVEEAGRYFLTRICQNRLTTENEKILDAIRAEESQDTLLVKVPRDTKKGIKSRTAKLEIRFNKYEIKRPAILENNKSLPASLCGWVIYAREIDPPKEKEPIEWFLMTNRPINNFSEAIMQIKNYTQRWKIERFHYVLKSGGCNIEKIQARSMDVTVSLIMIYSIISIFIMNMTYAARLTPELPCDEFFEEDEWKLLYCITYRTGKPPERPYSIKEAVEYIARLGSARRAPSDGPPGLKLIWDGLEIFYHIVTHAEGVSLYYSIYKKNEN